jgi:hypothetical protein
MVLTMLGASACASANSAGDHWHAMEENGAGIAYIVGEKARSSNSGAGSRAMKKS